MRYDVKAESYLIALSVELEHYFLSSLCSALLLEIQNRLFMHMNFIVASAHNIAVM